MQEPESAQLAYVRFKKLPVGHIFIIFRDKNGKEIALSPEAELAEGETFSLLRGFFKTYRLRYYEREPRSFIKEYREHGRTVVECALDFTPQELAELYTRMRTREKKLEEKPEWYHPVFNSCVNNVIDQLDDIWGKRRLLPKVLFIFAPTHLGSLYHSPKRARDRAMPNSHVQEEYATDAPLRTRPTDPVL